MLFYNKSDTDLHYNAAVLHLAHHNASPLSVNILATHNQHSLHLGMTLNSLGVQRRQDAPRTFSCTFDGHARKRFQDLLDQGETVNVYLPYGPYRYLLPYCLRRLYENWDSIRHLV